jgi:hypothetical protein
MQAENANTASRFDLPVTSVLVVVDDVELSCPTFAPDEWLLQAETSSDRPTTPAIASARSGARLRCELPPFVARALRAPVAISSPSQFADLRA